MTRRCSWDQGRNAKGKSGCPTWSPADGSTPRFKVSETVVRRSRERVARRGRCCAGQRKWRGPTTRRQSDHDLLAMSYSDGISIGDGEAQSPRIISSAASESSQRA